MPMLDHLAYTDVVQEVDGDYHVLEEAKPQESRCCILAPYAQGWKKYVTGWDIPYITDPVAGSKNYLKKENYKGKSLILFSGRVVLGPGLKWFAGVSCSIAGLAAYYLNSVVPDYLAAGFERPDYFYGRFFFFFILGSVCLVIAATMNPGIVPRRKKWSPEARRAVNENSGRVRERFICVESDRLQPNGNATIHQKYCHSCKIFRPPRSKHCSFCTFFYYFNSFLELQ